MASWHTHGDHGTRDEQVSDRAALDAITEERIARALALYEAALDSDSDPQHSRFAVEN